MPPFDRRRQFLETFPTGRGISNPKRSSTGSVNTPSGATRSTSRTGSDFAGSVMGRRVGRNPTPGIARKVGRYDKNESEEERRKKAKKLLRRRSAVARRIAARKSRG